MKILVLGAGLMGRAAAFDLVRNKDITDVVLADRDSEQLKAASQFVNSSKLSTFPLEVTNPGAVESLMKGCDAILSAVPYRFNAILARAAVAAGVSFCDLGGNNDIVAKEFELHEQAREKGITIIPDCGLAPGRVSLLAADAEERLDKMEEIHLRVGGLPVHPKPPLNYKIVFSPSGLINEYKEPALVIREGVVKEVASMTEVEELDFPEPFGKLEAFVTSGGTSTLPQSFLGKLRELDYKTIRYKGHCQLVKAMLDLGLGDEGSLEVDGKTVVPRRFFEALLLDRLSDQDGDVVLVRVVAEGLKNGKETGLVYTIIDYHDPEHGLSAMMRMTAFPISIIAQMLASGEIALKGALPQERCVPTGRFLEELGKRGISLEIEERPLSQR